MCSSLELHYPPESNHFVGLACISNYKESHQTPEDEDFVLLPDEDGVTRKVASCELDYIEELFIQLDPTDKIRLEKVVGPIDNIAIWAAMPGWLFVNRKPFNFWKYLEDEIIEEIESEQLNDKYDPAKETAWYYHIGLPYRVIG